MHPATCRCLRHDTLHTSGMIKYPQERAKKATSDAAFLSVSSLLQLRWIDKVVAMLKNHLHCSGLNNWFRQQLRQVGVEARCIADPVH